MATRKPKTAPKSGPTANSKAAPANGSSTPKEPKRFLERTSVIVGFLFATVAALGTGVSSIVLVLTFLSDQQAGPFKPTDTEQAAKYDQTNPAENCAPRPEDATTLDIIYLYSKQSGVLAGTLEIRHSPKCNTTWVRVTSAVDNVDVKMSMERAESETLPAASVDDTPIHVATITEVSGVVRTDQLYAPTCGLISVAATITDPSGSVVASYPLQPACHSTP